MMAMPKVFRTPFFAFCCRIGFHSHFVNDGVHKNEHRPSYLASSYSPKVARWLYKRFYLCLLVSGLFGCFILLRKSHETWKIKHDISLTQDHLSIICSKGTLWKFWQSEDMLISHLQNLIPNSCYHSLPLSWKHLGETQGESKQNVSQ